MSFIPILPGKRICVPDDTLDHILKIKHKEIETEKRIQEYHLKALLILRDENVQEGLSRDSDSSGTNSFSHQLALQLNASVPQSEGNFISIKVSKLTVNTVKKTYRVFGPLTVYVYKAFFSYLTYFKRSLKRIEKNPTSICRAAPKLEFIYHRVKKFSVDRLDRLERYFKEMQEFRATIKNPKTKKRLDTIREFVLKHDRHLGQIFIDFILCLLVKNSLALLDFINSPSTKEPSVKCLHEETYLEYVKDKIHQLKDEVNTYGKIKLVELNENDGVNINGEKKAFISTNEKEKVKADGSNEYCRVKNEETDTSDIVKKEEDLGICNDYDAYCCRLL